MAEGAIEFRGIGRENQDLIPGELIARRKCAQCLHWEDPGFWTGSEPDAILETKKKAWFQRVAADFGTCGQVGIRDGETVAFAEYAMPASFPGLAEYDIDLDANAPFIACFVVAASVRDQGVGTALLKVVEDDLRTRGYRSLQALARKSGPGTCGPLGFWTEMGYAPKAEKGDFTLVSKAL